jgi:DNA-binding beta-propeller fold protein YncE
MPADDSATPATATSAANHLTENVINQQGQNRIRENISKVKPGDDITTVKALLGEPSVQGKIRRKIAAGEPGAQPAENPVKTFLAYYFEQGDVITAPKLFLVFSTDDKLERGSTNIPDLQIGNLKVNPNMPQQAGNNINNQNNGTPAGNNAFISSGGWLAENSCQPTSSLDVGRRIATGIAIDQVNRKFYVANGTSSESLECYNFDGSSCGIFASGLADSYGLALENNLQYIWVTSSFKGCLERFSVSGQPNMPVETLNIAQDSGKRFPHDVAVDQAGNVYGVAGTSLVKYVPDANGHKVGILKDLGGYCFETSNESVAVINGRVYVGLNSGRDSQIRVFDADTLSELTNVDIGPWPYRHIPAGITSANGKIYVAFSSGEYSVFSETGDGVTSKLKWNEVYHCDKLSELKGIAVAEKENFVLVSVKFGGKVLKFGGQAQPYQAATAAPATSTAAAAVTNAAGNAVTIKAEPYQTHYETSGIVNLLGVLAAIAALIFSFIGQFVIIEGNSRMPAKLWPAFLVPGLACLGFSIFYRGPYVSAVLGIASAYFLLWITGLFRGKKISRIILIILYIFLLILLALANHARANIF